MEGIAAWLEGVRPGFGERFGKVLVESGYECADDLMTEDAAVDIALQLEKASNNSVVHISSFDPHLGAGFDARTSNRLLPCAMDACRRHRTGWL